jgi:hypothetical protein
MQIQQSTTPQAAKIEEMKDIITNSFKVKQLYQDLVLILKM